MKFTITIDTEDMQLVSGKRTTLTPEYAEVDLERLALACRDKMWKRGFAPILSAAGETVRSYPATSTVARIDWAYPRHLIERQLEPRVVREFEQFNHYHLPLLKSGLPWDES
jgi:hypothetical protein